MLCAAPRHWRGRPHACCVPPPGTGVDGPHACCVPPPGTGVDGPSRTLEAFDPVASEWRPLAPMPHPRASCAAVVLDCAGRTLIAVAGGGSSAVDVYAVGEDRWEVGNLGLQGNGGWGRGAGECSVGEWGHGGYEGMGAWPPTH